MGKISSFIRKSDNIMLLVIIILIFCVMGILAPRYFFRASNFRSMGIQLAEYGVLAFGMMLAMMSGGIDLSLVGIANLTSIICALVMLALGGSNFSIIIGIIASLLVGSLCGVFNGWLIGYIKIPAMIVTLSSLQLYKGISIAITKGPAITGLPVACSEFINAKILGIPMPFIIFALSAILLNFYLKSTVSGQQISYMGANQVASLFSGINNLKITLITYGISGVLGSIGGILMSFRYNSAKPDYGTSYTLLTLLIAVLGGTNPNGGFGNLMGVAMATIILQLVSSAFNILRVNAFIKTFIWGLLLIIVMIVTHFINNRRQGLKGILLRPLRACFKQSK